MLRMLLQLRFRRRLVLLLLIKMYLLLQRLLAILPGLISVSWVAWRWHWRRS